MVWILQINANICPSHERDRVDTKCRVRERLKTQPNFFVRNNPEIDLQKKESMKASKENHHLYNNRLRTYARQNRNGGTKAEACLWKYALSKKKTGYTFKRQRPVMNYIADFMCQDLKLIIEVDGSSHDSPEALAKDQKRQTDLEAAGFEVIRFTNAEVLRGMDRMRREIGRKIREIEASRASL